jgi:hypothetical protein
MSRVTSSGRDPVRWGRLILLAFAIDLGALELILLPALSGILHRAFVLYTPSWFRRCLPFALFVEAGLVLTIRPKRDISVTIPDLWWSRLDRASDRLLGWPPSRS